MSNRLPSKLINDESDIISTWHNMGKWDRSLTWEEKVNNAKNGCYRSEYRNEILETEQKIKESEEKKRRNL